MLPRDHVLEQGAPGPGHHVADPAVSLPRAADDRQHVSAAAETGELLELVDRDDDVTLERLRQPLRKIQAEPREVVGHLGTAERADRGLEPGRQRGERGAAIEHDIEVFAGRGQHFQGVFELSTKHLIRDPERARPEQLERWWRHLLGVDHDEVDIADPPRQLEDQAGLAHLAWADDRQPSVRTGSKLGDERRETRHLDGSIMKVAPDDRMVGLEHLEITVLATLPVGNLASRQPCRFANRDLPIRARRCRGRLPSAGSQGHVASSVGRVAGRRDEPGASSTSGMQAG
jgi:hypothetical protein